MAIRSGSRARRWLCRLAPVPVVLALAAIPASGSASGLSPTQTAFSRVSGPVLQRYVLAHPGDAPEGMASHVKATRAALAAARTAPPAPAALGTARQRFNQDFLGLPQNEESVAACSEQGQFVLGGTNDYRGLVNPTGNFTGWHFSTDDGQSVANEGLLPSVALNGHQVPSGGDPVDVATGNCDLYAASLNYPLDLDFTDLPAGTNGVTVYRSDPATLANCPGGDAGRCWPVRRFVATNRAGHFLDKEWMHVGRSGPAGRVVWVTYTDFDQSADDPAGFSASIFAVRCDAALDRCTAPQRISGDDRDVQFSDVTIGPDGRTYVTWAQVIGEVNGGPERFVLKSRVAPSGSTDFGPTRVVHSEDSPLPFNGRLHADDFRSATVPKSTVSMVGGTAREWVVWDACAVRVLGGTICEEAQVKLRWSDDQGATWSPVSTVSLGADNYFPTIAADPSTGRVAVAYYTSRYDEVFHNAQDVELVTVGVGGSVVTRTRVTPFSNEPEADPVLGGSFIGDYFEVDVRAGQAYVHYNANHVSVPLLGEGRPVPQQDNFLRRLPL